MIWLICICHFHKIIVIIIKALPLGGLLSCAKVCMYSVLCNSLGCRWGLYNDGDYSCLSYFSNWLVVALTTSHLGGTLNFVLYWSKWSDLNDGQIFSGDAMVANHRSSDAMFAIYCSSLYMRHSHTYRGPDLPIFTTQGSQKTIWGGEKCCPDTIKW